MDKKTKKKMKKMKKQDEKYEKKARKQRAKRGYADRDVWNLFDWYIDIMPRMLKKLRKYHAGVPMEIYTEEERKVLDQPYDESNKKEYDEITEAGSKRWEEVLDRMIFLLHEMDEEKCSMKNPYEEEVDKVNEEFVKKYGLFGDGYKTEEEKEEEKKGGYSIWKSANDVPENKELYKKYFAYEKKIAQYRIKCKNEYFRLTSKYFYDLWD